jgi:protein gp37
MGQKKYQHPFLGHLQMHEDELLKPLTWKKPRTVFVNSMSDLFHKDVDFTFIDKVFAVMALTPQHTYQILTKRADRLYRYFSEGKAATVQRWEDATYELGLSDKNDDPDAPACHVFNLCEQQWPRPNIWLGVSAEDQTTYDERVEELMRVDAHVRFVSYEPALGPIDITIYNAPHHQLCCVPDWIIAGGESGQKARPAHPDWFRSVRDQCELAGVKFFFKQWGRFIPSYQAGEKSEETADYKKTFGKRWAKKAHSFPDGLQVVPVGKKYSGNVLDGIQHLEYPE